MGKKLALVAAVARNGVIGKAGGMPWHIPEDLKHFKSVTTGHAIVMGRKTWDSIGRPLPHRHNIVVTRDPSPTLASLAVQGVSGSLTLHSVLEDAIEHAWALDEEPRVIGGGMIYAATIHLATAIYLTEIDRDVEGDVSFPAFDRSAFTEVSSMVGETPGVVFKEYRR